MLRMREDGVALSRDSGVPLYVQLRELVRIRIQAGEWREDEALPTEEVLAEAFAVSRATVRQALTDLVREGLILRRAGLGTFPRRAQMILRMERFLSFSDDLRERGLAPGTRLLGVSLVDASALPEAVAREFRTARFISISTLRLAAERPVVVFTHLFPADRFGFLMAEQLDDPELSFYELIVRRHGISYGRAVGEISAVEATDQECGLLELPEDGKRSIVELRTRTYDEDGVLMEYSRAVLRTDRYALTFSTDWRQEPR
jgi:GntR family transcriptional regulator